MMRRTALSVVLAIVATVMLAPVSSAAPDKEVLLDSQLSGDQVMQGGDPDGSGIATVLVDSHDGVACFDVQTANVA